ncbi:DNA primase [Candidatus Saccharibacteria bacterium]|nr:DNA primase [Candidatus Saccharibacteria bacterium]
MQDAKEEVRSRLAIEDVIGEYVQLKRAGRNFKGLSPFGDEKTPSFVVSPDKHIWHDFSSGKGGDIFSFVMEVEGMDFRAALEHLARKAGVDLSLYNNGNDKGLSEKKARLYAALDLAARYYQQSLLQNPHALDYVVKKRGLNKQTIGDFMIGYAPENSRALSGFLSKKGFSKQELLDAGLLNRFDGDLFRGRMTVPLMDAGGRVIGFTARTLKDEPNSPKYLNTPQTLLYDKSRHVFGLSQAKESIRKQDYAVVVEGNMDVISSHQAGVRAVVATAGTALTEQHLKAISRLSDSIRLAFDGDKAGVAASERAIEIAERVGVSLSIVSLPDGAKDPDELIQLGVKKWQQAIADARPAVEWIIQQYAAREDMSSAKGKRLFSSAALRVIATLKDSVEVEHYQQVVARTIDVSLDTLRQKTADLKAVTLGSAETTPLRATKNVKSNERSQGASDEYQNELLAVAMIDVTARRILGELEERHMNSSQPARAALLEYLQMHPSADMMGEVPSELHEISEYVKIVQLRADERYAAWSEPDRIHMAQQLVERAKKTYQHNQKDTLEAELREAEASGDDERSAMLLKKIQQLIRER